MRKLKTVVAAAATALVVVGASAAAALAAEDWPKWMGPRGDMISRETNLLPEWPEDGPKEVWAKDVGMSHSSPVAREGRIYLFTLTDRAKEVLTAFDAATGEEVWTQSYDRARVPGGGGLKNPDWDGTRATPTIDGNRIYTYGSAGDLVCRNLADGKQVWHLNVLKEAGGTNLEWGSSSSPLVEGDRVYVQAGIGEGAPVAVAVDKASGKILWKSQARGGPGAGGRFPYGAGYAHMILADVAGAKQLIVFGGRAVYGMDPDTGKMLWNSPWETQYDVNAATPVYRDGQVLISSEYSTAKGILYDVSADGLKQVWESTDIKCKYQPPILDEGHIYVNSRGTITCVRWKDGKTMWQADDERALRLGSGGSMLRVGDRLIAMSERGKLSMVQATPEGYKLLSQVDLLEGSNIWSTPLLYGGKLYVNGAGRFVCLDVSGK